MPNDYCTVCNNEKAKCTCGNTDGWCAPTDHPNPT